MKRSAYPWWIRKKVKSLSRVPLLATPRTTVAHRLSLSVHGIFQARVLERVAISFSRGIFPTQGSNPGLPHCRQTLLLSEPPGESNQVLIREASRSTDPSSAHTLCSHFRRGWALKWGVSALLDMFWPETCCRGWALWHWHWFFLSKTSVSAFSEDKAVFQESSSAGNKVKRPWY